ncbi:MAG: hypothetical protein ACTHMX_15995, partial [Thermomicrobiales bacterium]
MRAHVPESTPTSRPVAIPLLGAERARELERRAQAQLGMSAAQFREQVLDGTLDEGDFVVAGLTNLLPDEDILALSHASFISRPPMIEWETIAYDGFPYVLPPILGLTPEQGRIDFDRACLAQLGMSADVFNQRYQGGGGGGGGGGG